MISNIDKLTLGQLLGHLARILFTHEWSSIQPLDA